MKHLSILLAFGLATILPSPFLGAAGATAPSFLLLFADDLGYEKLGCYGGLEVATPNIDALSARGMRCTRAYTSPVCTPSRMSLITGMYTVHHGFYSVLPVHLGTKKKVDFSSRVTLPKVLRQAGYHTATTGKWQLATLEYHPDHIRSAGFDSWCVWQIWRDGAKTTRYWDPCFNLDGRIREDIADRYGPDVLAEYVVEQMRKARDAGRPFFIQHNMLLPHWPILETPNERRTGQEPSLDRMITYLDELVGRLVRSVDDLGIGDRTWILFMGDNGTDSKEARRTREGRVSGGKNTLTDAGMHVPLIVRAPGDRYAGTTLENLIDITDLFPTLVELAGAAERIPETLDGRSFARRLVEGTGQSHRDYVTAGLHGTDCVFDGTWRLQRGSRKVVDVSRFPEEQAVDPDSSTAARAAFDRLSSLLESLKAK